MNSLNNDILQLYQDIVSEIEELSITRLYNLLIGFQIEVNFSALRAVFAKYDNDQDGLQAIKNKLLHLIYLNQK